MLWLPAGIDSGTENAIGGLCTSSGSAYAALANAQKRSHSRAGAYDVFVKSNVWIPRPLGPCVVSGTDQTGVFTLVGGARSTFVPQ
jgi:hypothetical protein